MLARSPSTTYRPRERREYALRKRAGEQARARAAAAGASPMDQILARAEGEMAAVLGRMAAINSHKMKVHLVLERGPASADVRCWYSCLVDVLVRKRARTIDDALMVIALETVWRHEKERVFGLSLDVLRDVHREARLALRWMRRAGLGHRFPDLLAAMREPPPAGPAHPFTERALTAAPRFTEPL